MSYSSSRSPQDLINCSFGRYGTFAGGLCFPSSQKEGKEKDDQNVKGHHVHSLHPMQTFMSQLAQLLSELLSLDAKSEQFPTQKDTLLTQITKLTMDAGVGSMVGQSVGESIVSIKNWIRRSKLGFLPTNFFPTCISQDKNDKSNSTNSSSSGSSSNSSTNVRVQTSKGGYADLARSNIFFKKACCMMMAASQDLQDEVSRLDFYFGPQIDSELNAWQLNILFLTFLKVPLKHRLDPLTLYTLNSVRKMLEVHVEGRHFILTAEIISKFAEFMGRIDQMDLGEGEGGNNDDNGVIDDDLGSNSEEEFEDRNNNKKKSFSRMTFLRRDVKDDSWQLCLNSNCLPAALLLAHKKRSEDDGLDLFNKQMYSLYFGAVGLAEVHIFDVHFDFMDELSPEALAMYGKSELSTLATAAMAMGDEKILKLLPVQYCQDLTKQVEFVESISKLFDSDEPLCTLQMWFAHLSYRLRLNLRAPIYRLNYASRPQISVQYFHNRQSFLWSHGFVHFDVSPQRLLTLLTKPYIEPDFKYLIFKEESTLKMIQCSLRNDGSELIIRAKAVIKFNLLNHKYERRSGNDLEIFPITFGDVIIASYEDLNGDEGPLAGPSASMEALISSSFNSNLELNNDNTNDSNIEEDDVVRESFLQLAAHVNSYVSKDAIVALIERF